MLQWQLCGSELRRSQQFPGSFALVPYAITYLDTDKYDLFSKLVAVLRTIKLILRVGCQNKKETKAFCQSLAANCVHGTGRRNGVGIAAGEAVHGEHRVP